MEDVNREPSGSGQLRDFAVERDWEQFHSPKNLVMALAGEVGELTEIFQWLTPDESAGVMVEAASARRVREEMPMFSPIC